MITSMKTVDPRELLDDTFSYREAREAGLSDARIYGLRDAGAILTLGGGVYRWSDAPPADLDLVEVAERVPRATLCLETALARHDLVDSIPAAIDVAIPRGKTRPALKAPCRLHQFDPQTFDLGRETIDVDARTPLGIYSAERSLVDIIRIRHLQGSDIAWEALRRWLHQPGTSPARLIQTAKHFAHAEQAIRKALEVLL
jgi:predicted transcriptional regulator of viral defense system